MDNQLFRGTRPRVFSTNPADPEEGRTFVWAWTEWFERIEGPYGNVVFTPVAAYDQEFFDLLSREGLEEPDEVSGEFEKNVCEEFLEQTPLFPEAPEVSNEEPFGEQNPDEDIEHG